MIHSPTTAKNPKGVRKRVMMGPPSGLPSTYGHPSLRLSSSGSPTSISSKSRYLTPLERMKNALRSLLRTLLVLSFPIAIFLLPFLLSSKRDAQDYPPVIVTLSTTPARLPFLQPTLDSILKEQTLPPTRVYLVLLDPTTQEDGLRGSLDFQNGIDLLEEYEKDQVLQDLVETTPILSVLQPKIGFGPLSKIVYALEHEATHHNADATSTERESSDLESTSRLVYLDDDIQYDNNLLRQLVDASLDHPQAAVAITGGRLRELFRQVRYASPAVDYDKVPNIVLHSWNTHGDEAMVVDIVQAVTGVCVPMTLLNQTQMIHDVLPQTQQQQDQWPDISGTGDVLVSAVMESQNITRMLVPATIEDAEDIRHVRFSNYSTNILSRSGKAQKNDYDNAMEWMDTVLFVQKRIGIWEKHLFLDLSQLTAKQKQAIACEALHETDCESVLDACIPSANECPEAQSILSELESNAAASDAKQSEDSDNGSSG